jgi:ribonuclease HII
MLLKSLFEKTLIIFAGDEVGRGCLAGPMVVCLVVSDKFKKNSLINDSKQLSKLKRLSLVAEFKSKIKFGMGIVSPAEIDEFGLTLATKMALGRAERALVLTYGVKSPDKIVFDGTVDYKYSTADFETIKKGDTKFIEIALAANFAKVFRDEVMNLYNNLYGKYNFAKNVGYGTKVHIESLRSLGTTRIHRELFLRKLNEQKKLTSNGQLQCG